MLHPLLQRQLKKTGLAGGAPPRDPDQWKEFLERVSRAYSDADQDRYTIERSLIISSDEMHRLNESLAAEKRALEMIADGAPLSEVLDAIARSIEEQAGDALCSICLLDPNGNTLRHGAAPSLPDSYNQEIDGLVIGPTVGSCGTAAYLGEQIVVSDIATDPRWAKFRDLALGHGLRACWSTPVMATSGEVLGTFAMYYREARDPSREHQRLVERATHVAGIAIEQDRAERALRESEERLRTVVTNTPVVLFALDRGGIFTLSEGKGLDALRLKPGEVVGSSVYDLYRDAPDVLESIGRAFGGEAHSAAVRVGDLTFETRFAPVRDPAGEVTGLTGVATDVTERKRAEEELQDREETLRATIESTENGILVVDGEGNVAHANGRFVEMWGVPPALIEGGDDEKLIEFTLDQLKEPDAFLAKVRELYQTAREDTDTLFFKDGRVFERFSRPLMSGEQVAGRVWSFSDVTERRRAEEQLREYAERLEQAVEVEHEQAVTDALTGLANHRGAHLRLEQVMAEAHEKGGSVSLVLADVDGFKLFNDTFGHTAGDDILRLVAAAFCDVSRPADLACRYGGDEFLLILPGKGRRAALTVARRITGMLGRSEFRADLGERVPVSLSVGIATLPRDATTIEKLIAAADSAMYDAKRRGTGDGSGESSIGDAGGVRQHVRRAGQPRAGHRRQGPLHQTPQRRSGRVRHEAGGAAWPLPGGAARARGRRPPARRRQARRAGRAAEEAGCPSPRRSTK